jgi:hypothetical protein
MYSYPKYRDFKHYRSLQPVNKTRMDNIRLAIVCIFVMIMIFSVRAIDNARNKEIVLTAQQYIDTCEAPVMVYSSIDQ